MAEVGAREVLGPDSIIPLHIFLAESTQPEKIRGNTQFNVIFCQGIQMPPLLKDLAGAGTLQHSLESSQRNGCDCSAEQPQS